jgi:hypothetical protein
MVSYCSNPDCKVHNEDLFSPPELASIISCCLFIALGFAIFVVGVVVAVIALINIKG